MADYYTYFSVVLPAPADPELAARIPEWVRAHQEMQKLMQEGADCDAIWDYEDLDKEGYGCNFMVYDNYNRYLRGLSPTPTVWVYSDENWNPNSAATLIQRYLDDFEIEGGVLMNYAYACSKPRVNEAGGGAIVITRNDMIRVCAESAVLDEARDAGVEILNR